jgi:hypothetical protein
VDDHQRAMWNEMLRKLAATRAGDLSLGRLVSDLRGLYVEADPHDSGVRRRFEEAWAQLDGEHELRSELWAPPGAASDEALARHLAHFEDFAESVLATDRSDDHR